MNNITRKEIVIIIVTVLVLLILFVRIEQVVIAHEKPRGDQCISNLKQIGLALRMYSQEYNDFFPAKDGRCGFELLRSGGYLENVKMYTCPSSSDQILDNSDLSTASVSYMYVPGLNENISPANNPIARDRDFRHKSLKFSTTISIRFTNIEYCPTYEHGNVLFVDGHASKILEPEWSEIISKNNFTY